MDAMRDVVEEYVMRHHRYELQENQCSAYLVRHIRASHHLVWSIVRAFDQPQNYKPFVHSCSVGGNVGVGCIRQVNVKSGLPATASTERLERLDDNELLLKVRFLGGDHRLKNYTSTMTVHPEIIDGRQGTMVIESYVADVPRGNTKEETRFFVEALVKCNLKSLADVSERLASHHHHTAR